MAKVYCNNCKWKVGVTRCSRSYICKENALGVRVEYEKCFTKNKNNNCKDFEFASAWQMFRRTINL